MYSGDGSSQLRTTMCKTFMEEKKCSVSAKVIIKYPIYDKSMYITSNDKQNYPFCRSKLLV